jgi:hypothetical protein
MHFTIRYRDGCALLTSGHFPFPCRISAKFVERGLDEPGRITLPRTLVNRGENEGLSPMLGPSSYSVSTLGDTIDDSLDHGSGTLGVHSLRAYAQGHIS